MKVADLLEARRRNWRELEELCSRLEGGGRRGMPAATSAQFASLYRSACADLALSDSYQLPQGTVLYLHRLVGRAHNQLYRSRIFNFRAWGEILFTDVPQCVFRDGCVQFAFCFFWITFIVSAWLAASPDRWPGFAEQMIGDETIHQLESNFAEPIRGRNASVDPIMVGFYIQHNTSIGLQCFAGGLAVLPGMFVTLFNSSYLGACFGYMARPDVPAGKNFFHFVTAHGPFELTAIALSFGAGLRIGLSLFATRSLSRVASLRKTARESMPIMGCAMGLFFLAAMIEGFLSPSAAPYAVKAAVAVISSGLLMFYFVVLGYPRSASRAV